MTDKIFDNGEAWFPDGAGNDVQAAPISKALVAAASTDQVVAKKSDGSLYLKTVSGGGGGGGLVLLDSQTASNSASLDFTTGIDDTYDEYELHVVGLVPATDNTHLQLQFSTDTGSSWIATAYHHALRNLFADGFDGEFNSTSATNIPLATGIGNASGEHWNVKVLLPNLRSALFKMAQWYGSGLISNPLYGAAHGAGGHGTTTAIDALRLTMSSGNIASGVARLYGVAKP